MCYTISVFLWFSREQNNMIIDTTTPVLHAYLTEGEDAVLSLIGQGVDTDLLLLYCAQHGDVGGVSFALQYCKPTAHNSKALRLAVQYGHYDAAELLIPHSQVGAEKSAALARAVKNQDPKMVELLLPHSNARDDKSYALYCAIVNQNQEIAKLLWEHSNLGAVGERLRALRNQSRNKIDFTHCLEDWPIFWQRETYENAVSEVRSDFLTPPTRKI